MVKARGDGVDVSVQTVLGELELSSCYLGYTMRSDAAGRTLIANVVFGGKSPCNDVRQCFDSTHRFPWRGRLEADGAGRVYHNIDMCLDTCMGRFRGPLVVRLHRERAGRWRVTAQRLLVGASGWQFDGAWALEGARLDIRPRRR